jgi:cyclic pyranopterin phosphate synthase
VAGNSANGVSDGDSGSGSSIALRFPTKEEHFGSRDDNNNNKRYNRYCTSLTTQTGLQQNTKRSYSSSFAPKNDGGKNSGQEHHSFFQEQMLELEKEQKQFGQERDDHDHENDGLNVDADVTLGTADASSFSSPPSEDQHNEMRSQIFNDMIEHTFERAILGDDDNEDDSVGEEREDRFEFTAEDIAAWGKPNPDPVDMQIVVEQIAREREKEASYAKSASLSPQSTGENDSKTITEQQKPQSPEHHDSFSHLTGDGSSVHMVDVGHKAVTRRTAHARSEVWLPREILEAFLPDAPSSQRGGDNCSTDELVGPKGPIFATAKIAGIMACKKTSDLIPLCHPLPLDQVQVDIKLISSNSSDGGAASDGSGTVVIDCTCKVTHKTGVEMEALIGATVAALTIYDMTKAMSHNIRIKETRLIGKEGGKRTVLDGIENKK